MVGRLCITILLFNIDGIKMEVNSKQISSKRNGSRRRRRSRNNGNGMNKPNGTTRTCQFTLLNSIEIEMNHETQNENKGKKKKKLAE